MRIKYQSSTALSVMLAIFQVADGSEKPAIQKPNVLFICVDDLRPELGCYGAGYIKSPNIDKLAASGVLFTQQFVQVPTCGASRCSLLTRMVPGRLPGTALAGLRAGTYDVKVTARNSIGLIRTDTTQNEIIVKAPIRRIRFFR
jgi:hypothetical protein